MTTVNSRLVSLKQIFAELPLEMALPEPDIPISGISVDSRLVRPGEIFVALVGGSTDGHRYIRGAIERGAVVVVGSQTQTGLPVPYLRVPDTRRIMPHLAAAYFGHPGRRLTVIGITGTDGKTTTANLIFNILRAAGLQAGMISTVSAVIGDQVVDTGFHVTTPDPQDIQRYMAMMVEEGLTHVVIEATSHGLAQYRVDGCEFDVGVVTNITHEHLDYHGSYEAYREAKARLFLLLSETHPKSFWTPKIAVLNRDDTSYGYLSNQLPVAEINYGINPVAEFRAEDIQGDQHGLRFTAISHTQQFEISSRLIGHYNVSNCLAALASTVIALKLPVEAAQAGIASFQGVPGRLERIELGQKFTCMVDFAHTPNALTSLLKAIRPLTGGRIITVFGSAGLRDRAKRRMMAEISSQLADLSIFTAEDPRSESLSQILEEMAQGAESTGGVEGKSFFRIPDRGNAIRFAVRQARPNDVVIACGKGHEQSMCFGDIEYPWDDRTAMRAALLELLGLRAPQMPYLPTSDGKMDAR